MDLRGRNRCDLVAICPFPDWMRQNPFVILHSETAKNYLYFFPSINLQLVLSSEKLNIEEGKNSNENSKTNFMIFVAIFFYFYVLLITSLVTTAGLWILHKKKSVSFTLAFNLGRLDHSPCPELNFWTPLQKIEETLVKSGYVHATFC